MNIIDAKGTWVIDPAHSEISFKIKHMMISTVSGHFETFDGQAVVSEDGFKNAVFTFNAKINSINTKNKDRDNHLKSADFFNAQTYPDLTFISKSYDGNKLVGDLTIKDITKEVILDMAYNGAAVDPYGNTKAGFEINGKINRKDFGLSWNAVTEAGSIVVGENVNLVVDIQAIKSV